MWPLARTDDVLAAFYVADEGRADPVGVATALAKGARQLGVTIAEGVAATGVRTKARRVTAVMTEKGPVETETVVNAAGIWARQFGALAGVRIPLQAAEHYYLLTGKVDGMDPDLPVIEDPDRYGYYRPEGDGMLVGLFEPKAAAWSLDGVRRDFSFGKLPPDWERMEPFLAAAMDRIPCLADTGVRTFFCGPESFTSDVHPMLGPAPELDGYFVAAGLNSIGILSGGGVGRAVAHWIVDGVPPVDVTGYAVERTAAARDVAPVPGRADRRSCSARCSATTSGPTWQPRTARNVRRSVLHDRQAAAGAHFAVSAGWEYPEWFFAGPGEPPATTMDWPPPARVRPDRRGARRDPRRGRHPGHEPDGQLPGAGPGRGHGARAGCPPTTSRPATAASSTPSGWTGRAASSPTSRSPSWPPTGSWSWPAT